MTNLFLISQNRLFSCSGIGLLIRVSCFKVFVEKIDRGQNGLKINQHVKDTEIYRNVKLKWTGPSRIRDN